MDFKTVRQSIRGPGVLVSSIFDDGFRLRPDAIERNIAAIVERGFGKDGGFLVAPCGDGEYVTLNEEEITQVVTAARAGSNGQLPVVAGVNSPDIRVAFGMAEAARKAGAVALMAAPPMYYHLNEEAVIDYYHRLAAAVDIGIMLYEQSWRGPAVNAGMTPDLVGRLLDIPNVVAIKHLGGFALADEFTIIDRYKDRLAYIDSSGGYATTAAHMHGATGWVTEIAPIWPEFEMHYWQLLESGQYREAELWRARFAPVFQFVHAHPPTQTAYSWVSIIKAALDYVGLEGGPVRPPFRVLNEAERRPLIALLEQVGVPKAVRKAA
jgi:dihydrodipicolinate synthase/N-acetylneuraminate lyase